MMDDLEVELSTKGDEMKPMIFFLMTEALTGIILVIYIFLVHLGQFWSNLVKSGLILSIFV